MKKLFYTIGICIVLTIGCSDGRNRSNILFTNPQPEGEKDLSEFPKNLLGQYQSELDNDQLIIHSDEISLLKHYSEKRSIKDLDSTSILIGDTLLKNTHDGSQLQVKRTGDSITVYSNETDTLGIYNLDNDYVLRKFKNSYKFPSRRWLVYLQIGKEK